MTHTPTYAFLTICILFIIGIWYFLYRNGFFNKDFIKPLDRKQELLNAIELKQNEINNCYRSIEITNDSDVTRVLHIRVDKLRQDKADLEIELKKID